MNDWKLIVRVVFGSASLLLLIIIGLSRMSGTTTGIKVDEKMLVTGASLVKEVQNPKVTVVTFSDVQCPACKLAHEKNKELLSDPQVNVVYRHFPLTIHKNSTVTAKAVEAARVMGKGWEMLDLLYAKQSEWSVEPKIEDKMVEYAKSLGLDEKTFREKINSPEVAAVVSSDLALGESLKLNGTPTVYVNGEQVAADFVMAKVKQLLGK